MRDALGMSSYQLARRIGVSQTRIMQFERAEANGSIRLAALRRAAEALSCTLVYALVPKEPLEDIVLRQAHLRAAAQLSISDPDHPPAGDPDQVPRSKIDELEDLTLHFVDHRQLWS